jgi:chemotaxis protein MotB
MMNRIIFVAVIVSIAGSCVAPKKYKEEQLRTMSLRKENEELMSELNKLKNQKGDLEKSHTELKSENERLRQDTAHCGNKLRELQNKYKQLNSLYEDQVDQNKALLSSSTSERQKLLKELDTKQRELFEKEKALDKKQEDINNLTAQLEAREKRVKELEELIAQKDAAVSKLKKNIEDALLGFDKNELSITIKDGKIYVSLSEKLLFQSGSTEVDRKGREALNKLAQVLEKQQDISIMIEGHTDNVPIKTACIKDNWDLSVLRATSIVRILTIDNKVDVKKVIPSGRGEYMPVASNATKEDRARNRRTEIILSPNLDKIFKILEGK